MFDTGRVLVANLQLAPRDYNQDNGMKGVSEELMEEPKQGDADKIAAGANRLGNTN